MTSRQTRKSKSSTTSSVASRAASRTRTERRRRKARKSFLSFVEHTFPSYLAGWVHKDLCARLERFSADVAAMRSPRLMISLPPRHGKTFLAAERFPVWHLGQFPKHEIIVAGHNQALSYKSSRAARRLITEPETQGIFPALRLAADAKKVSLWNTSEGGAFHAVGVNAGVAGHGAHILVTDDLLKGYADALSETKRESVWQWYAADAYTRLAPGGGVLSIGTRWSEDDPQGRLQRMAALGEGDEFEIVNYAAIAELDEMFRAAGEALHPDRFPVERLEQIMRVLPEQWWESLYMGRPTTKGGAIWKEGWWLRWQEGHLPAHFDRIIHSWDASFGSQSDKASWVVGQIWGEYNGAFFLLDQVRGRWTFPQMVREVKGLLAHPRWGASVCDGVYVEAKANGQAIIDTLNEETDFPMIPVIPRGSKSARAHAQAPKIKGARCYIPEDDYADWVPEFIQETKTFPNASADDQVDAASQALEALGDGGLGLVLPSETLVATASGLLVPSAAMNIQHLGYTGHR